MRLAQIFTMSLLVLGLPAKAAPHADAAMVRIRLWSTTTYAKVLVDRPPTQQVGKGDLVLVESTLRNAAPQFGRPRGAVVGRDTVSFRVRSPRSADMTLEMDLPGGVLRAAGRVRFGPIQRYGVTGGGGRFTNARGVGESSALRADSDRRLKIYRLRLR